jgi:hypothetical protein
MTRRPLQRARASHARPTTRNGTRGANSATTGQSRGAHAAETQPQSGTSTRGLRTPTADRSFDACAHTYRKKEHDFLKMQVEMKSIAYNTEFDLLVEHCEMKRDADSMSLRPWSKGTGEITSQLPLGPLTCGYFLPLLLATDRGVVGSARGTNHRRKHQELGGWSSGVRPIHRTFPAIR